MIRQKAMLNFIKDIISFKEENSINQSCWPNRCNLNSGDIYNRKQHNLTLNRLINLDVFKFVKNRFELPQADSLNLNAFYYLTPQQQKSLRAEFTYVTRSNSLNGSDITLSWTHRNLFRNGSHVKLSAYVGSDIQFSGALSGYNTFRTGAEADFCHATFPGSLFPYRKLWWLCATH